MQVGYVDRLVGTLVRRLKQAGLYDRALVVVTADHGISFEPGGPPRSVTRENLPDIAGVPLFVKYPGQQRGLVDRRDAQTIDIVPTIADVIGARIPWHIDGLSLRGKPVVRPVTVRGPEGGSVSAGVDAVAAGVLATARRNAALFGQGPDSLYRLGVHRELLGRSVAALPPSTVERVGARLVDEELFDGVRTTSLFSSSHIVGEVQGVSLSPGTPVAIVVDERVAATTRTFGPDGRHFEAMVPEGAFHDGKNTVDVFRVREVDGAKRSGRQVSSSVVAGQVSDGDDGAP